MAAWGAGTRPGRHWVVTAVAMALLSPVLVWWSFQSGGRYEDCTRVHGPAEATADKPIDQHPCYDAAVSVLLSAVGFYTLVLVTVLVGLILGVVAGRRRQRFAHGRWVAMTVVGLTAPWALLAYAIGHGLGRVLPARRTVSSDTIFAQGRQEAVRLYAGLAAGHPPPTVLAPDFLAADVVYLDAPFQFARWYGADVSYGGGGVVAFGRPGFVAAALIGDAVGRSVAARRAANLAAAQWRAHLPSRVVVTGTDTWCLVEGRWLSFAHDGVVEYQLHSAAAVLMFSDTDPLRLSGPSAWCHAVLFAYLRYGPERWQAAPFLAELRAAASRLPGPS